MNDKKPAIFSVWKLIGLLIAFAALGYKVCYTVANYDSIAKWWAGTIFIFFAAYLTSIATAVNSFTRGMITMITSAVMIFISLIMLSLDVLCFLGFAASLEDATLTERGIFPVVNLLNILASIFDLIGFLFIRHREKNRKG
ncbi:MAG: hypothetical protein K6C99_11835 [Lachnospiraceae bacterium]|nr:hypothetical protein [Lachnospiraceae bacterium]